jgi:hypothetical protein
LLCRVRLITNSNLVGCSTGRSAVYSFGFVDEDGGATP